MKYVKSKFQEESPLKGSFVSLGICGMGVEEDGEGEGGVLSTADCEEAISTSRLVG